MTVSIVLTVIGACSVVALVWAEVVGSGLKMLAKPLASACFIGVAIAAGATDSAYGSWVLVALILSAIGDVALLGRSSAAFLAGLVSFLLGHVGYAVAFSVRGLDVAATVGTAAALVVVAAVVLRWLWPHVPGEMRGPVVAYVVVISTMVAAAAGTVAAEGDARILVAASGFFVSDLAVARDRFVAPGPDNRLWGLPLYYAAQFLFAWTVVV